MRPSDDEINDDIKKILSNSFENFEGDFGKSFDKKVLRTVKEPKRRVLLFTSMAIILLITGTLLLSGEVFGPFKNSGKTTSSARVHVGNEAVTSAGQTTNVKEIQAPEKNASAPAITYAKSSQLALQNQKAVEKPVNVRLKTNVIAAQNEKEKLNKYENSNYRIVADSISYSMTGGTEPDFRAKPRQEMLSADEIRESPYLVDMQIDPLENEQQVFLETHLKMPEIVSGQAAKEESGKQKPKQFALLLNVAPLKTFQYANINGGDTRIQNLAISGPDLALGYKLNVGVAHKGYQLLFNYTRLRSQIRYEYGLEKFETTETSSGNYVIKRLGQEVVQNDRMDMLGIGARKQFNVLPGMLGKDAFQVEFEYARGIQQFQRNWLFVNMSIGKRISLNKRSDIHLGPYFEYSLTNRYSINNQLVLKSYQIGLSAGLRLQPRR
jgi:hypothetical protein